MKIMVNGWAKAVAAALIGLLGCVATTSGSDAGSTTSQFFVMPLTKSFLPPSGFGPPNVARSNQSFVLVPQQLDMMAFRQPFRPASLGRPPFLRHKVEARLIVIGHATHEESAVLRSDARLLVIGGSLKDDDRLRRPGEGVREGGVTVLRPSSPKV
jgi:hypothetical protein